MSRGCRKNGHKMDYVTGLCERCGLSEAAIIEANARRELREAKTADRVRRDTRIRRAKRVKGIVGS